MEKELSHTLQELTNLGGALESVACVPVGVTRYREGLYPLQTYTREGACAVLDIVEHFGECCLRERGSRTVYVSDEFYLLAGRPVPPAAYYEEFPQIENGVGMLASMEEEFTSALGSLSADVLPFPRRVTVITGEAASKIYPRIA